MKKIILFLVLLFTCVLIRAHFEEAGKSTGIEVWMMNEECEPEKVVLEESDNPSKYYALYENNIYIILKTNASESTSNPSYEIYYVFGRFIDLEKRKKAIEHVIKLWKKIGFNNVTIIRKRNKIGFSFKKINEIQIRKKIDLHYFEGCNGRKRLYKLSRNDEGGWTNNDGHRILKILQVPYKIEMLTNKHDFVLECDSKVLIFNMSNKSNTKLEKNSQKLAELITKNKLAILSKTWNKRNPPPDWFLKRFPSDENYNSLIQFINRNSSKNTSHKVKLEVTKFTSDKEDNNSSSFYSNDGYLLGKLNEKHTYFVRNDDIHEAFIYLGNKADFENIESALIAGEELNDDDDIFRYEISVVQKHTLSVPFVLAFYEIQKHFHRVEVENIMQLLIEEDV